MSGCSLTRSGFYLVHSAVPGTFHALAPLVFLRSLHGVSPPLPGGFLSRFERKYILRLTKRLSRVSI